MASYSITLGDKITHPLGLISVPAFSKAWGAHTTKKLALEIIRREGCIDASPVVFSTPSPLSRNIGFKIVRGGVLSYHPSVIVSDGTLECRGGTGGHPL